MCQAQKKYSYWTTDTIILYFLFLCNFPFTFPLYFNSITIFGYRFSYLRSSSPKNYTKFSQVKSYVVSSDWNIEEQAMENPVSGKSYIRLNIFCNSPVNILYCYRLLLISTGVRIWNYLYLSSFACFIGDNNHVGVRCLLSTFVLALGSYLV